MVIQIKKDGGMISRKLFVLLVIGINLLVLVILWPTSCQSETTVETSPALTPSLSFRSTNDGNSHEDIENTVARLESLIHTLQAFLSKSSGSDITETSLEDEDPVTVLESTDTTLPFPAENVSKSIPCSDFRFSSHLGQRGSFWVLYNYIQASRQFACEDSITYTTHADYTFLDNLVPLLERWQGPVSLTVYCPGDDYDQTLARIQYLRECSSTLVKELVTFHLFFDREHIPKNISQTPLKLWEESPVDCTAQHNFGEKNATFQKRKHMFYPVNVARNIAREMAQTHFVLASDIELYPNPGLIQNFLHMFKENSEIQQPNPKLFVLPIFEVEANVTALPFDKAELLTMLGKGLAIPFHKYVCPTCHSIPKQNEWIQADMTPGLSVFHTGKRHGQFKHWEPLYIGTKLDPMYDERLTWEGKSDKMTQAYVLCVLDYDFHILDNAFLVHRPGTKKKGMRASPAMVAQSKMISKYICPELNLLYGTRPGC